MVIAVLSCLVLAVTALTGGPALAQSGAKALFYSGSGATQMTSPSSAPARPPTGSPRPIKDEYMGIAYWIELLTRDGHTRRVTADRQFRSGDRFKLHVQSNRSGYLYVFNVGSTGRTAVLFPNASVAASNNAVDAHRQYAIPPTDHIRFDDNPGEETIVLVLSPRPMDGPDAQRPQSAVAKSEELDRVLANAQVRGAKDLVVEVDSASPQPASYAVAPVQSLNDGTTIMLRIKLQHQ